MAVSPFNRGESIVDAEGEPASYNGKTDTRDGFSLTGGGFRSPIAIKRSAGR